MTSESETGSDAEIPEPEKADRNDDSEFHRDRFPDVSDSDLGPLSLRDDWDPDVGYEIYNDWAREMATIKLKKRLKSAKKLLLPGIAVAVILLVLKLLAKRFRLLAPLLRWSGRVNGKFRTITRTPAEYRPMSYKFGH